jgi:hypothetical protein
MGAPGLSVVHATDKVQIDRRRALLWAKLHNNTLSDTARIG